MLNEAYACSLIVLEYSFDNFAENLEFNNCRGVCLSLCPEIVTEYASFRPLICS